MNPSRGLVSAHNSMCCCMHLAEQLSVLLWRALRTHGHEAPYCAYLRILSDSRTYLYIRWLLPACFVHLWVSDVCTSFYHFLRFLCRADERIHRRRRYMMTRSLLIFSPMEHISVVLYTDSRWIHRLTCNIIISFTRVCFFTSLPRLCVPPSSRLFWSISTPLCRVTCQRSCML